MIMGSHNLPTSCAGDLYLLATDMQKGHDIRDTQTVLSTVVLSALVNECA